MILLGEPGLRLNVMNDDLKFVRERRQLAYERLGFAAAGTQLLAGNVELAGGFRENSQANAAVQLVREDRLQLILVCLAQEGHDVSPILASGAHEEGDRARHGRPRNL